MTSAADPGREPGGPTPPLIFRPNLGPKCRKKFFWDRPYPPTPTPALSQSLADRSPRLFKGLGPPLDLAYKGLRTCIWIRFLVWEIQYLACVQTSPPPSGKNWEIWLPIFSWGRRGRLYTGYTILRSANAKWRWIESKLSFCEMNKKDLHVMYSTVFWCKIAIKK